MSLAVVTEAEVEAALSKVVGPCTIAMGRPIDLVSFGKVEHISIKGDDVTVRLLEDPMCYFVRPILRSVEDVLLAMPGVKHVHIEFSTTQLWTPELMRTVPTAAKSR